ncbi:hypothetical protein PPL_04251 [Heterostelium album PN500]|uniref:Uncharacterized protein n=1 Tax=Heterostelium pallidum (strain ATCC 26659 / Pp 5 / PN500) TaxID=670386 RepID=D3B720_HETP5|nr:hypothetical protein PPL_04251 [Heterostelium album PN500]EFA82563.1 hypothetical protein PPL_04251 [Heterostelium album PN500]|eukprot:XP_020434680.1 hypothetical protein PPL_04251 [Heterostelium album PN500]
MQINELDLQKLKDHSNNLTMEWMKQMKSTKSRIFRSCILESEPCQSIFRQHLE